MKIKYLGAAVAALALSAGMSGCALAGIPFAAKQLAPEASPTPATFVVSGAITIPISDEQWPVGNGAACNGGGGYSDIHQGSQVSVTDQTGSTIAIGSLSEGILNNARCTLGFQVSQIPEGATFYKVHIGNVNRGELTYTRDQLNSSVELSLG